MGGVQEGQPTESTISKIAGGLLKVSNVQGLAYDLRFGRRGELWGYSQVRELGVAPKVLGLLKRLAVRFIITIRRMRTES